MIRYKHVIWDWNGTLLNDTQLCVEVLNGLLHKQGFDAIDETVYRERFGFPVVDFYKQLGFDVSGDKFKQLSRDFIAGYESKWFEHCQLHPDTATALNKIAELGVTQSVLSAAKQEALEIGINHFGIAKQFTDLIGIDNIYADGKVGQGKKWMEQSSLQSDEVVLVGDTLHDNEVANAIGCDSILISHGHNSRERLVASGVPVVDSWPELLSYIRPSSMS